MSIGVLRTLLWVVVSVGVWGLGSGESCPLEISTLCQCELWLSGLQLDCSSRNITQVTDILKELRSPINQLVFKNTPIPHLNAEEFSGIFIKHLQLVNASLTQVDEDAFLGLEEKLESLILRNNNLSAVPFIGNLSRLTRMDLGGNALSDIEERAFPPNLRELRLNNNSICAFSSTNSLNETKSSLELLDLSGNCFHRIPAANIRGSHKLISLDLSMNEIENVPNLQFMNLPLLKEVRLSHNHIRSVMPLAFMNVPNLSHLYLRGNEISILQPNRYQAFKRLEFLDLAHNHIKEVPSSSFKEIHNLQEIILDGNAIESIETLAFSACPKLRAITISNNKLSRLFRNAFDSLPGMMHLILANNQLNYVGPGQFSGMQNLQYINLRNNNIEEIATNAFAQTPLLTTLDLGENELTSLPPNAFQGLRKLFWLDLCCNRFQTFPPGTFTSKVTNMLLHGNELNCTEELDWFVGYLVRNNIRTFLPDQEEVVCTNPPDVEGMRLKDLMIKKANQTFFRKMNELVPVTGVTKLPLGNLIPGLGRIPGLSPGIPGITRSSVVTPQSVIKNMPQSIPGYPGLDISKIPPSTIRHVLNGGQIPGVSRAVLDKLVQQYFQQMAAANHPNANEVGKNVPVSSSQGRETATKTPITTQTRAVIDEVSKGVSWSRVGTKGTTELWGGARVTGSPSLPPPPPALISPTDLLRLMSKEINLSQLPTDLLQKIARGESISLSMIPPEIVESIKQSNPQLALQLGNQFLAPEEESRRTKSPNRILPPTLPPPSPESKKETYDLRDVDRTADISDPTLFNNQDNLPLYTGIGLACVGILTVATIFFLCYRRRRSNAESQDIDRTTFLGTGANNSPKSFDSLTLNLNNHSNSNINNTNSNNFNNNIHPPPSHPPPPIPTLTLPQHFNRSHHFDPYRDQNGSYRDPNGAAPAYAAYMGYATPSDYRRTEM